MGAINELVEHLKQPKEGANNPSDICYLAYKALPDLQRLVEWAKHAEHGYACSQDEEGCICGLSEIQSLLGE